MYLSKISKNFLNPNLRMFSQTSRKVAEASQEKLMKVAIIGLPNAGKSTFINSMMDQRVCPASEKVHTTRSFAQVITNRQNSQIIVFDTPGLVTDKEIKQYKLDEKFMSSCRHSIQNSYLIGVLHDVSNRWTRNELHPVILDLLKEYHKIPSFLILNKIDRVRHKRTLLDVVSALTCNNLSLKMKGLKPRTSEIKDVPLDKNREHEKKKEIGWPEFKRVFMVSSINGNGIEEVFNFVKSQSVVKPWVYKNNETTDQTQEALIVQFVNARLLDYLPQEIPYKLKVELEYFTKEKGRVMASVLIICPSERIERFVCGEKEGKLTQITDRITSDLIESFSCAVTLMLSTVVIKKTT